MHCSAFTFFLISLSSLLPCLLAKGGKQMGLPGIIKRDSRRETRAGKSQQLIYRDNTFIPLQNLKTTKPGKITFNGTVIFQWQYLSLMRSIDFWLWRRRRGQTSGPSSVRGCWFLCSDLYMYISVWRWLPHTTSVASPLLSSSDSQEACCSPIFPRTHDCPAPTLVSKSWWF